MEEIEASTEAIEETIRHTAQHSKDKWFSQVALSSALFAVFAAVTALISNHHANEAMIDQIRASDQWGYFQAKGIKSGLLSTKMEILSSLGKSVSKQDQDKLLSYKKEQTEISEEAQKFEEHSTKHLKHHVVLSRGVTLFQVAIAVSAIALLTHRRRFWIASLGFAAIGLGFLIQGLFLIT